MAGLIPFNKNIQSMSSPRFNSFYSMLDDFFSDPPPMGRSLFNDTFKLDVCENNGEYCIEAELPGAKREEIDLTVDEGKLTITVNRTEESSGEKANYIHRERKTSSMIRSVYLADANSEAVNAKLNDGILRITVPKSIPADTKRNIEIN